MLKRIDWTTVEQRPVCPSIRRVLKAAQGFNAASEEDLAEVAALFAQTTTPKSARELIGRLNVREKALANEKLKELQTEKIEAGLNAFYDIFDSMVESDLGYQASLRRRRLHGEDTLKEYLSCCAFQACPTPILGLHADHFSFLMNYKDPSWGARHGREIARKLLEDSSKFNRKLVEATIREVLGSESRDYHKSNEEEIIKGFTDLFMMARG